MASLKALFLDINAMTGTLPGSWSAFTGVEMM
jgi:hypothetical protein